MFQVLCVARYTTRRMNVPNFYVSDIDAMLGICLKHVCTSDYRQTVQLLLVLLGWQTQQTVVTFPLPNEVSSTVKSWTYKILRCLGNSFPPSTPAYLYPYPHPHRKVNTWFTITPKDEKRRRVLNNVNVINANKSGITGKCYSTQNRVRNFPQSLSNGSDYELFYHGTNHGSAKIIIEDGIDLNRGLNGKDFSNGDGFYVGRDLDEALGAKWDNCRPPVSAVIIFRVMKNELREQTIAGLDLQNDEHQWNEVVREFRSGKPNKNFLKGLMKYEYIEGPMSSGERKSSTNHIPVPGSYQLCVRPGDENDERQSYRCANLFDRSIHSVIFFER